MKVELRVPSAGESITQGQIASWLKKDGELVRKGEDLFEFETEKASMAVPSPADGRLEILVLAGEEVSIDQVVAIIETDESASAPAEAKAAQSDIKPPPSETKPQPGEKPELPNESRPPAGEGKPAPSERERPPSSGKVVSADSVTRSPLSMVRKTIARRLVQARQEAAHLTTFNEADMSELIRIRKAYGEEFSSKYKVKLGYMSFFVKAAVRALQEYPVVNSRIEGDELVSPGFFDIGVAVSTERGLLVPVIRNADRLSFGEIELKLSELAVRAREKSIELSELQGGTFTITNGGIFGSMLSTPIPNYPQSAILGMHAIQRRPIAVGEEIRIAPMMYLAMTYDHRLIDGREAVLFLVKVKECIENPERLILGV